MRERPDPFEEGARAAASGIPRGENPYDPETEREPFAAWEQGWLSIDPEE